MLARVEYHGESVNADWLTKIASQPGEVWIENRDGELILVYEFEDQRRQDEQTTEEGLPVSEVRALEEVQVGSQADARDA